MPTQPLRRHYPSDVKRRETICGLPLWKGNAVAERNPQKLDCKTCLRVLVLRKVITLEQLPFPIRLTNAIRKKYGLPLLPRQPHKYAPGHKT